MQEFREFNFLFTICKLTQQTINNKSYKFMNVYISESTKGVIEMKKKKHSDTQFKKSCLENGFVLLKG